MRIVFVVFTILLFSFTIEFNPLLAQEITYQSSPDNNVQFKVDQLQTLQGGAKFKYDPYYQFFLMCGDGNFGRYGNLADPVVDGSTFNYKYRDLENDFPGVGLLIARKDDDDPPEEDDMLIVPPFDPSGNNHIRVLGEAPPLQPSPGKPLFSNEISGSFPKSPMLPNGSTDVIVAGLSHYAHRGGYFVEANSVHSFPIAFKPKNNGVLFFFYQNSVDGEEFEYYKNVSLSSNGTNLKVGTIAPNYFDPMDVTIDDLISKMGVVREFDESHPFLLSRNIQIAGSPFDRVVAYNFSGADANLINDPNGVAFPPSNSPTPGELRLFHFIKSGPSFKDEGTVDFLAVLYVKGDTVNTTQLSSLNAIDSLNFPEVLVEGSLSFVGYDIVTARKGEPNDPGGLIIENIQADGDEYIVDFELTFCNAENAPATATIANVYLESYPLSNAAPLLTDIRLLSTCVNPVLPDDGLDMCVNLNCPGTPPPIDVIQPDTSFCYDFMQINEGLAKAECGAIKFSARIDDDEVYRLTQEHIMRYCVQFNLGPDAEEFCLPNVILQDSICVLDTLQLPPEVICNTNPIWTDKDISVKPKKFYYPLMIGIVIGIIIGICCCSLYIKKRRKHRKKHHKKH